MSIIENRTVNNNNTTGINMERLVGFLPHKIIRRSGWLSLFRVSVLCGCMGLVSSEVIAGGNTNSSVLNVPIDSTGNFKILSSNSEICDVYVEALNEKVKHSQPYCERFVGTFNGITQFQKVGKKIEDSNKNLNWREIRKYRSLLNFYKPGQISPDSYIPPKDELILFDNLYDIDNNGTKDKLVIYKEYGCKQEQAVWDLDLIVLTDKFNINTEVNNLIYGSYLEGLSHHLENRIRDSFGLFEYEGNTYFDHWGRRRTEFDKLNVFMIKNMERKHLCEIQYLERSIN